LNDTKKARSHLINKATVLAAQSLSGTYSRTYNKTN